jgi:hypothetical protein
MARATEVGVTMRMPSVSGRHSHVARLTSRASNDMTLVQSKSTQNINQPLVIHRLHILPVLVQIPQIIRDIPPIKLPNLEPIA